jgi:predicted small lipoprotein YifL
MGKIMPRFRTKYNFIPVLVLFLVICMLAGCGIKPDDLSPPKDQDTPTFPRTYPAPQP